MFCSISCEKRPETARDWYHDIALNHSFHLVPITSQANPGEGSYEAFKTTTPVKFIHVKRVSNLTKILPKIYFLFYSPLIWQFFYSLSVNWPLTYCYLSSVCSLRRKNDVKVTNCNILKFNLASYLCCLFISANSDCLYKNSHNFLVSQPNLEISFSKASQMIHLAPSYVITSTIYCKLARFVNQIKEIEIYRILIYKPNHCGMCVLRQLICQIFLNLFRHQKCVRFLKEAYVASVISDRLLSNMLQIRSENTLVCVSFSVA